VAWFVGQDCGNFLLTGKLKFRRHFSPTEGFLAWVWIAFLSEQMSSCTYLITVFHAVTALIIVLILTSSRRPSISRRGWHSPAKWGQGGGGPDLSVLPELAKCPYLGNLIGEGLS